MITYMNELVNSRSGLAVFYPVFHKLFGPLHHGYPLRLEPARHALENITPPWAGKAQVSDCKGGSTHSTRSWLLRFIVTSSFRTFSISSLKTFYFSSKMSPERKRNTLLGTLHKRTPCLKRMWQCLCHLVCSEVGKQMSPTEVI